MHFWIFFFSECWQSTLFNFFFFHLLLPALSWFGKNRKSSMDIAIMESVKDLSLICTVEMKGVFHTQCTVDEEDSAISEHDPYLSRTDGRPICFIPAQWRWKILLASRFPTSDLQLLVLAPFPSSAPSQPLPLRQKPSLDSFKSRLKIFLFPKWRLAIFSPVFPPLFGSLLIFY